MEKEKKQAVGIAVAACCLAAAVYFMDYQENRIGPDDKIVRGNQGEGSRTEELLVGIKGSKEKTPVTVQVEERAYADGEERKVLQKAAKELDGLILGENKSFDHVDQNLKLITSLPELPVTVSWQLSRYDVMETDGTLLPDKLTPEGIMVTLNGLLKCKEEEALYEQAVMLFPAEKEGEAAVVQKAEQELRRKAAEADTEAEIDLPREVDGEELVWYRADANRGPFILVLGGILSVCPYLLKRQKEMEKRKAREQQMLSDYPEIISQFTLLTGAGMTVKNAWRMILKNYLKKRKAGQERFAYEEMAVSWNEMKSGIPEQECYERFGARCGLQIYMRFGALLSQNLKKGAAGLQDTLRAEAASAFEERKRRAREKGEEAGTKLLIPMFLMLAVVLLIVIVPAFLSMQM